MKENTENLGETYRYVVKDWINYFVINGDFEEVPVANFGDDFCGENPASSKVVFGDEVDDLTEGSDMVVLNESLFLYLNGHVRELFGEEKHADPIAFIKEDSVLVSIGEGSGQNSHQAANEENWPLYVHLRLPFTLKKELLDRDKAFGIVSG